MKDYISSEEFKKQSKKVQEELIEFCKYSHCLCECEDNIVYVLFMNKVIPLMQMHQLVRFAEEKTGCVFDINICERNLEDTKWTYKFDMHRYDTVECFKLMGSYVVEAEDLLQAWWQLVIKII